MAAVLACGHGAVASHLSGAWLWSVRGSDLVEVEVSIPARRDCRPPGIFVHRRLLPAEDRAVRDGIPVTSIVRTLLDLAPRVGLGTLERAVNEADRLDHIDPESLRAEIDRRRGQSGIAILRTLLDRDTFTLTDSELERRFLPLARRAGLPDPLTQQYLHGFRVDFYWPDLGLVVETDGLRYHRTPAQQARDRRRDQAHAAAGLTSVRFTHAQVARERAYVVDTLTRVTQRLAARPGRLGS